MRTIDPSRLGLAEGARVLDVGCGEGRHAHAAALEGETGIEVFGIDLDVERLQRARDDYETYVAPVVDDAALEGGAPEVDDEARGGDEAVVDDEVREDDAPVIVDDAARGDGSSAVDDAGAIDDRPVADGGALAGGSASPRAPSLAFLRGDALALPFPDGAFDAVVCSEVLEHLPAYGDALDELARVLRPGGRLAVSVPRYGPERVCWALNDEYHAVEGGHVRIFRRETLRAAVEARGFEWTDGHFAHALHSPYWWLKCLWWDREKPPAPLRWYERFLEWDVLTEPRPVRLAERALDPVLGKSAVLYFLKR